MELKDINELNEKELKEQIDHLESMLPSITDRNELSGTLEVIGRLETKLEILKEQDND